MMHEGSGSAGTGPVQNAGLLGAAVALAAAILFAAAAGASGPVARIGGAVWVFILTWIILMPVLAPWLGARRRARQALATSGLARSSRGGPAGRAPADAMEAGQQGEPGAGPGGDRLLAALVLLAGGAFFGAMLWLFFGVR